MQGLNLIRTHQIGTLWCRAFWRVRLDYACCEKLITLFLSPFMSMCVVVGRLLGAFPGNFCACPIGAR